MAATRATLKLKIQATPVMLYFISHRGGEICPLYLTYLAKVAAVLQPQGTKSRSKASALVKGNVSEFPISYMYVFWGLKGPPSW